jgi:hypothetical protein
MSPLHFRFTPLNLVPNDSPGAGTLLGGRQSPGFQVAIVSILISVLQFGSAFAAEQADDPEKEVIEHIGRCLTDGKEAVLLATAVKCKDYGTGIKLLHQEDPNMPFGYGADELCANADTTARDWRKLSGKAIKHIYATQKAPLGTTGIRIVGAVFCDTVDLVGLDLPYSVVIDGSFLRQGLDARNFRVRGDLSFDESRALAKITIRRALIDGAIFGSDAYIDYLEILDSEIYGSMLFRNSVFLSPIVLDTISLSGELSVRDSALSYFLLQFSKIGGIVDLTASQARCAYVIRKIEAGDLAVVDAGFGISHGAPRRHRGLGSTFHWINHNLSTSAGTIIKGPSSTAENHDCRYQRIASAGAFILSDIHVKFQLCLRSFHWMAPIEGGQRASVLTLNDLTVGGTTFIDLAPVSNDKTITDRGEERRFESTGIKTGSFIFNFDLGIEIQKTAINGLSFDEFYFAEIPCFYDPGFPNVAEKFTPRLENISDPSHAQLRVPQADEVTKWLGKNCLETTQPFSAFADVAQKTGNYNDAKQFRIARASKELDLRLLRLRRLFKTERPSCYTDAVTANTPRSPTASVFHRFTTFVNDLIIGIFGVLLWLVADHGYRPEKVGWFVVGTILAAWIYFWGWARVVGFLPAGKYTIRPIGFAFLFDRLLPAYRIRDDHYHIDTFYRRTNRLRARNYDRLADHEAIKMKYLWWTVSVIKADEKDVYRAEVCLDVIKVIGLTLAIFLIAAINAIFRQ